MTDRHALERQLLTHEGLRLRPYVDTVGKITIGVGHNLTDRGLTREQCMKIFADDIELAISELVAKYPWVERLDSTRQAVLADMSFNLGIAKLSQFRRTLHAIQAGRYSDASVFMLDSLWAKQVGRRALTLATMMDSGINPFAEATS